MKKVDIILFTYNRSCQADLALRSIKDHFENIGSVFLFYKHSTPEFQKGYEKLFTKDYGFHLRRGYQHDFGRDFKSLYNLLDTNYYTGFCFRRGEKVETKQGMVDIQDVNVGDLVRTHTGEFHKVLKRIKNLHKYSSPYIKISTSNSITKCTAEHPFLVKHLDKVSWIKAEEIRPQMELLYPYKGGQDSLEMNCLYYNKDKKRSSSYSENPGFNDKFTNLVVDEDLARFLGLYLAEGNTASDSIRFTLNRNEDEYVNFIVRICKEKFQREPKVWRTQASNIKLNFRSFRSKFIEWFGEYAHSKQVPDFVFSWSLKNKLAFLSGYLDGDGTKRDEKCWRFHSVSLKLISGINKLLIDCGLETIKVDTRANNDMICGNKVKSRPIHSGGLTVKATSKFEDLLSATIYKDYLAIKVKETKEIFYSKNEDVYNLEVEKDNSYIVNSAIVHNCDDDVFIRRTNCDEILEKFNEPDVSSISLKIHANQTWGYPGVDTPLPAFIETEPFLKWNWRKYHRGDVDWGYPTNVNAMIFPRQYFADLIMSNTFSCPNSMEGSLNNVRFKFKDCLVSFRETKVLNIAANLVQTMGQTPKIKNVTTTEELNKRFLDGEIISTENVYNKESMFTSTELSYQFKRG